ncbi:hypothetical protein, partial [Citrobacter koseri]|uniref:hypothetical protein n=1 Tax=Citrobacter koseri TaxID=545 RepID=UPI001F23DF97
LITQLKILFNIWLFYGDVPHICLCCQGSLCFGISCCASFLSSIKYRSHASFWRAGAAKSQRKIFFISTFFNTVFYA